MFSEIIYFYLLFFSIIGAALGIILAPRMYFACLSMFLLVCLSSLLYLSLDAIYIAVFQFILCGIFLSVYMFLLLKKIGRLNLNLKLVAVPKVIVSCLFTLILGAVTYLYFKEEFTNSLFEIFNFVTIKSSDVVDFKLHIFPLILVILLVFISLTVIRVFLLRQQAVETLSEVVSSKDSEEDENV